MHYCSDGSNYNALSDNALHFFLPNHTIQHARRRTGKTKTQQLQLRQLTVTNIVQCSGPLGTGNDPGATGTGRAAHLLPEAVGCRAADRRLSTTPSRLENYRMMVSSHS